MAAPLAGNTCCDPPNLPYAWFNRIIDPSTADIELRLCQDEDTMKEDVAVSCLNCTVSVPRWLNC